MSTYFMMAQYGHDGPWRFIVIAIGFLLQLRFLVLFGLYLVLL